MLTPPWPCVVGVALGTFSGVEGASQCLNCAAGRFAPNNRTTECEQCHRGRAQSLQGQSTCDPCVPGRFAGTLGQVQCALCDPGKYQRLTRAATVSPVWPARTRISRARRPASRASPVTRRRTKRSSAMLAKRASYLNQTAGVCELCAPGSITSSIAQINCTLCEAGEHARRQTNQLCHAHSTLCWADRCVSVASLASGTYSPLSGSSVCLSCDTGRFSSSAGSTDCQRCPDGEFTASIRSTSCGECAPGLIKNSEGDGCGPARLVRWARRGRMASRGAWLVQQAASAGARRDELYRLRAWNDLGRFRPVDLRAL